MPDKDPKIFTVRLSAPETKSSAVVEPIIAVAAVTSMRPSSKLEEEDGRVLEIASRNAVCRYSPGFKINRNVIKTEESSGEVKTFFAMTSAYISSGI